MIIAKCDDCGKEEYAHVEHEELTYAHLLQLHLPYGWAMKIENDEVLCCACVEEQPANWTPLRYVATREGDNE